MTERIPQMRLAPMSFSEEEEAKCEVVLKEFEMTNITRDWSKLRE
jgi:hypothetical protein